MTDDHDYISAQVAAPVTGQQLGYGVLKVHSGEVCKGRFCCIHYPSLHHMVTWELNWRADTGVMERICPHGVGHPDPDHISYVLSLSGSNSWQEVHGCDGCCHPGGGTE